MLQSVSQQIVQSPARLGLTPASSPSLHGAATTPKLSSQILQSHNQQSGSSAATTSGAATSTASATSSSLLYLLPPLSRAQTILAQMASLSSKLFEVSPNRAVWLNAFRGTLPTFLSSQTLPSNPPPLDPNLSSGKDILTLFTSLQTQLFEAVAELQEILDLQDVKEKVTREIRAKDSCILAFANKLKEAERVLDILVDDYSDYRYPKRLKSVAGEDDDDDDESSCVTTVSSKLSLSDIISYAHRISYTTFAPPEFGAGLAPLRGVMPPAPQDEQMRASQLYAFADLDVGLPKTDESKDIEIETFIETPAAQPVDNSYPLSNLPAIQDIKVPSGWKPGMPVELPADLPLPMPPPGWKPGDPISLPPSHSLSGPGRVDEQMQRPGFGLQKGPEPIQVRHVQLDIDQDDDSSDYSSDDESSDDED